MFKSRRSNGTLKVYWFLAIIFVGLQALGRKLGLAWRSAPTPASAPTTNPGTPVETNVNQPVPSAPSPARPGELEQTLQKNLSTEMHTKETVNTSPSGVSAPAK